MAKLVAPLLSHEARGALGDRLTFQHAQGRPRVLAYSVPSGAPSVAQSEVRDLWPWLIAYRQNLTVEQAKSLSRAAALLRIPQPALITKTLVPILRGQSTVAGVIASWPSYRAPGPTDPSVIAGPSRLQVYSTPPNVPSGWVHTWTRLFALPMQSPYEPFVGPIKQNGVPGPRPEIWIGGLTTGQQYTVGITCQYTAHGTVEVYSQSVEVIGTAG